MREIHKYRIHLQMGAVIALSILAGLAILVVIPVLAICLYLKTKAAQSHTADKEEEELDKSTSKGPAVKQRDSLPCRLKKRATVLTSSNGTRSAGESGVYDMAELSHLELVVSPC